MVSMLSKTQTLSQKMSHKYHKKVVVTEDGSGGWVAETVFWMVEGANIAYGNTPDEAMHNLLKANMQS